MYAVPAAPPFLPPPNLAVTASRRTASIGVDPETGNPLYDTETIDFEAFVRMVARNSPINQFGIDVGQFKIAGYVTTELPSWVLLRPQSRFQGVLKNMRGTDMAGEIVILPIANPMSELLGAIGVYFEADFISNGGG